MSENQTRPTSADARAFVEAVDHPVRRADALALLAMFERVTGQPPVLWGPTIVGFGQHHYVYESGREGDWMVVGFSPRKAHLVLYGLTAAPGATEAQDRLGKHRTGVGCLYVNKLADVDLDELERMVGSAWEARPR